MNPMDRIWEARAALKMARRDAQAAWNEYDRQERERSPSSDPRATRAQAATHLPEDMRELLGIDRYGAKTR